MNIRTYQNSRQKHRTSVLKRRQLISQLMFLCMKIDTHTSTSALNRRHMSVISYTGCFTRYRPLIFVYKNKIMIIINEICYGHTLVHEKHGDATANVGSGGL